MQSGDGIRLFQDLSRLVGAQINAYARSICAQRCAEDVLQRVSAMVEEFNTGVHRISRTVLSYLDHEDFLLRQTGHHLESHLRGLLHHGLRQRASTLVPVLIAVLDNGVGLDRIDDLRVLLLLLGSIMPSVAQLYPQIWRHAGLDETQQLRFQNDLAVHNSPGALHYYPLSAEAAMKANASPSGKRVRRDDMDDAAAIDSQSPKVLRTDRDSPHCHAGFDAEMGDE